MDIRVDRPGTIRISVYNVAGQRVALLLNEYRGAGNHRAQWDGRNEKGAMVGNGTYLVVIEGPTGRSVRKIIVLK